MKNRALLLFTLASVVGCTPTYDLAPLGDAFLLHWNSSVPSEILQLKDSSSNGYASKGGDITLMYKKGLYGPSWMLISSVEAEGDMVCTELLISSTKMSYNHASSMVGETVTRKSIKDGNLDFYMNRGGGGVICSVSVTKK